MKDSDIIELYWARDAGAIDETAHKYGGYCRAIAKNILGSDEDAEECVNDAYWNAWNSIPPQRPEALSAYLGRIVRNLSFDRARRNSAEKRGGGQLEAVLEELSECLSGAGSVEEEFDRRELVRSIDDFLDTLPRGKRELFLGRYWYACPVAELAQAFGLSRANVSVSLHRLREKLKAYLLERGHDL